MTEKTVNLDELTYEAAFSELENLIQELEASPPGLEESLALYERGKALERYCAALLDKAELRVRLLTDEESQ